MARSSRDKKLLLEKFGAFIDELGRRRRRWTRAGRELYEAIARSLARSAVRQSRLELSK